MIDRVGQAITFASGSFVMAGQLIDQVNTTAEAIAVLLFAAGVLVGAVRAFRRAIRFFVKADEIIQLLQGLDRRLRHGDARMSRIEGQVGLDPLPPLDEHHDA